MVKLTHGTTTFLFTGDASQEQEEAYMYDIGSIDVLKVGHHGSHSSTSKEFINYIQPSIAVILCGADNKYGHPHKETLDTLQGISLYRTDEMGTIHLESDGNSVTLRS